MTGKEFLQMIQESAKEPAREIPIKPLPPAINSVRAVYNMMAIPANLETLEDGTVTAEFGVTLSPEIFAEYSEIDGIITAIYEYDLQSVPAIWNYFKSQIPNAMERAIKADTLAKYSAFFQTFCDDVRFDAYN